MTKTHAALNVSVVVIVSAACASILKGTTQHVSDRATASTGDTRAVQGNWMPTKADLAGQPMADAVLSIGSLKLNNGTYEVFDGGNPDKGTCKPDPAAKPKGMAVTGADGPKVGPFPANYELEGDMLRIYYDHSGAKCPTEFKSISGTQLCLVTHIRKKASEASRSLLIMCSAVCLT